MVEPAGRLAVEPIGLLSTLGKVGFNGNRETAQEGVTPMLIYPGLLLGLRSFLVSIELALF